LAGTIDLDEVTVTERKRSERYLERRKVIQKYEPVVSDIGKYYDLPFPKVSDKYGMNLLDFVASQGYRLNTSNNVEYILLGNSSSFLGPKQGYLIIDGRPVVPEELKSLHLQMKDIENVMVNVGATVTIFQVFTSDAYGENTSVPFDEFVITNGFDRAKKYYSPLYAFERSRPINLTEVDWKPNLKTYNAEKVNFKIAKDDKGNGLLFFIQGFSNEGHLISKTIEID